MISILNNLSALSAENSLSTTQANLQSTLTHLSTGLRINSGADDPAGLSIADGMQANIAALTQSSQNATNSVGMLQTADSALSQVSTLLNRAVTLATEGANGDLTAGANGQATALDTEYQSILSEINQIGQTTDYNGQNVFSSSTPTSFESTQGGLSANTLLTPGSVTTIKDAQTGQTFSFTAGASSKISDLQSAITTAVGAGTLSAGTTASLSANGNLKIGTTTAGDSIQVASNDAVVGSMNSSDPNNTITFISDGTQTGAANTTIQTAISALSANGLNLGSTSLTTSSGSSTALTAINDAINIVSAQRGTIGASINRLTAASNVMTSQIQNLTSASNNLTNANVATTVANMTQYNILESTGMAALQQANSSQQNILKLLQ